jgi:hypothetical protein
MVYAPKGGGMEVCTACFVASCREHAYLHYNKTTHQFSIAIRLVGSSQEEVYTLFYLLALQLTYEFCVERELRIRGT